MFQLFFSCPAGGDVSPHRASVREAQLLHGFGGVSPQHRPQLAERVREVAGGLERRGELRGRDSPSCNATDLPTVSRFLPNANF